MKLKSILVLSLIFSQLTVGKSFADDSVTQIVLSEEVESPKQLEGVVNKLKSRIERMVVQDGTSLDDKISVQQCSFEVGSQVYGRLDKDPTTNYEVFVIYHSKYGKAISASFCNHGGFGGDLYNMTPQNGLGNL